MRRVALLRALNVGGHTVTMTRLRTLFEALGLDDVQTVIASGNVLFSTRARSVPALERRIEAHLFKSLGYEVETFLRSGEELAAASTAHPDPALGEALSVLFLREALTPAQRRALAALDTPTDEFSAVGREAYWLRHGRISDSKVTGRQLEKALGGPFTARNITTVRKLAAAAR